MTIFLTPKNKKYKCNKVTMTIGGYTMEGERCIYS